ncbi:MAG: DUF389 domain-containing protein [Acidobacteriota bacterium]|nr:DUF389 domain-containing protein [Acidobacteriota bacterium]
MPEALESVVFAQTHLQVWLRIDERTKPKMYGQVFESARISSLNYWLEIVFSAAIATFGLVLNSPAVIIGAMLISPLMGPIMATGLALAVGDLYLAIKAVANVILSVAAAIGLAAFIVWSLPFHSATSEIIARSNPNLLDLGIAIFSGLAGSVVLCRGAGGGGVTALPGVAIAVALMPPLCTMGFGWGSGNNLKIMGGAGLLFLTNLVAIVSSAFLVFLLVGLNSPLVSAEMKRAQKDDPFAQLLSHGLLGRALAHGGQLRWRILILAVLLGAIAVPLRRALLQVAGETLARSVVQSEVKNLAPPSALVSQQVQIGNENISIRLISTQNIAPVQIQKTEQSIARRTGRRVELSVQEVASKSELADLVAQLAVPAPVSPPVPVKTLDEMRQEVLARITPAITAAWPPEVPLQGFDFAFNATGIECNVKYQADKELGPIPLSIIVRDLRDKLKTPNISLTATKIPAPRGKARKGR